MTLPNGNVAGYLNYHYGRNILFVYDSVKKTHEHYQSIILNLQYLKSCRSNNIIPKFLWFKTTNRGLSMSSAYKECQRRLLNAEINSKYRDLNISKRNYFYFLDELKQHIPDNVFQHVSKYIINRSRAVLYRKKRNLEKKFTSYELRQTRVCRVDRKVVKNLSSRVLLNEEIDLLARGLDYGLAFLRMLMI